MICETIKIKNLDGFIIINESDFDDEKHELFFEKELKEGSVEWLKSELKSLGVEFPECAKKTELNYLLDSKLEE